MGKLQSQPAEAYRPALDDHARRLIARIQRDQSDMEAVLALKAHYEAHGDRPSLANLMEGWAQTLPEPDAAADAYVAAAEAVLKADDRARARWLCRLALERSPHHPPARSLIKALEAARSVPPPPPSTRRASANANESNAPQPVSDIRSIESSLDWLDDEDLEPADEGGSRTGRYEETQRIWRASIIR